MKAKVIYLFIILVSFSSYAENIKIKIDPIRPVYKEPYEVSFTVRLTSDSEPSISFTPINMEVISKTQAGTQTQATFINGEASITKSITYIYEVVSNRFGTAYMKDIKVTSGADTFRHPTERISILQQAKTLKNVFVRAEVNKDEVFVGESIIVRYYLYNKLETPVTSTDIKKFPKLDKFLKRFHQEPMSPERVRLNGNNYSRRIIYTAQLFAQKPGTFNIDPITLRVGYSSGRSGMSNFGFNFRLGESKRTTAISDLKEIEVLPLPLPFPEKFTGLVGVHNFSAKINKQKFIVNEPIEIQLDVAGEGALELFDPFSILPFTEVEEFEKNADLEIHKDFKATKKTMFTYLARSALDLKDYKVGFSYFDLDSRSYKEVMLNLGNITISGGGKPVNTVKPKDEQPMSPPQNYSAPINNEPFDLAPFFKPLNTVLYSAKEITLVFASLIFLVVLMMIRKLYMRWRESRANVGVYERVCRDGLNYHDFLLLTETVGISGNIREKINQLNISESAKGYYLELLDKLNQHFQKQEGGRIKVKKKYIKELQQLSRRENETSYKL